MEPLEPRILLSAGALDLFIPDLDADSAAQDDSAPEPLPDPGVPAHSVREIVFVDPRVTDYQDLVEMIREARGASVEIRVLEAGQDGIRQISEALAGRQGLDAIHVVSHGADGRLLLGNGWLDRAAVETSPEAVAGWSRALATDGDLLFYGCDLASTSEGRAFLALLRDLTGLDIAASDDITGSASLGGDWELEYHAGRIDAASIFDERIQKHWIASLNSSPLIVNNTGSTVAEGGTDTITTSELLYSSTHGAGDMIYTVTAGPAYGQLELTTAPGVSISSFNQTDIDANRLVYVHGGASTPVSDSFTFDVRAQSGGSTNFNETFSFSITPVNDAPVVNDQAFAVDENSANGTLVGTVIASDEDPLDTLSYSITAGNTGNAFVIDAATGEIRVNDVTQLDFEATPSFSLTVQVQDNGTGTLTDTAVVTVNLNDINDAPVVNDQAFAVDENSANGTLVGAVLASDQDAADTLSYSITAGNTGNAFVIDAATGEIRVNDVTQLDFEATPSFSLTVQVQDNGTGTLTDTAVVTVSLNDINESPVVNDQTLSVAAGSLGGAVVGYVSASDPDNGTVLSYSIIATDGHAPSDFSIDPLSGQVVINDAGNLGVAGASHSFTVEVRDDGAGLLSDVAVITVNVVAGTNAPTIDLVTHIVSPLPENSATGTLVVDVDASDIDLDTITYSIISGNTAGAFSINSSTGEISVADGTLLDFETTAAYNLGVQASDGSLTDSVLVAINLSDVNDAPVVNDQVFSVDENSAVGTLVGAVLASDQDAADTLTYSITAGNTGNAFAIDAATGELRVNNAVLLDFEATPSFSLTVQVQDNGTGTLTDTAVVTVNLNDINDAPVVNNQSFAVDENSANGTLVGTVLASDQDAADTLSYSITAGNTGNAFVIDAATGEIRVNDVTQLDFEATPSFSLTVQVQDNGAGTLTDTAVVTVNLNDINDAPVVNDQAFAVDENSANGTLVGTVLASDQDPLDTLTYSILAGNTGNAFVIDAATGELRVNNVTQLDFEVTPSFSLTVQVQDNGTGTLVDTALVTVGLNDLNEAPVVNDQSFAVDENSANGALVGTVLASDQDPLDTLSYTLTAGNTGNAFVIDAATGELRVNNSALLDFEATPSFTLTVQVQDNGTGTLTDTAVVTVNLNDINDAPVVNDQSFAVDENSANGTLVGTVLASDQDAADTLTYTLTAGNTGNAFAIDAATGELRVNDVTQLDFEATPAFTLTVQVQDDGTGTLTDAAFVTVNLNDINDAPVVNDQSFAVDENSVNGTLVGAVLASDQDAADTLSYSITAGNTGNAFVVDSATGEIRVNDMMLLDFEVTPSFALTVQVQDNGTGTLADTALVTVNLNNIDDTAPVAVANTGITLSEGGSFTLSTAVLQFVDSDQPPSNVVYQVIEPPLNGRLEFVGNPGVAVSVFTQADVDAGLLVYQHDGSDTLADSVLFNVDDGQGNRVTEQTLAITVTPVDDTAPHVVNNTGASAAPGEGFVVTADMLQVGDAQPATSISYRLESLPAGAVLELNGAALGVNDTFTQADIDAGRLFYRQDDATSGGFGFSVDDGLGNRLDGVYFSVGVTPPEVFQPVLTLDTTTPPPPLLPPPGVVSVPPDPAPESGPVLRGGGSHGELESGGEAETAPAPVAEVETEPSSPGAEQTIREALETDSVVDAGEGEARAAVLPDKTPVLQDTHLSDALWQALERTQADIDASGEGRFPWLLAATRGVVWTFSAGFVAWMLRGGSLLAMTLSSMPMWRWIDPLPILPLGRREREERKRRSRDEAEREVKERAAVAAVLDGKADSRGEL